jgi:Sec-independent protein secretion pathway component TatC
MTLMAGPLVLFYELSILVARVVERRRRAPAGAPSEA